MEVHVHVAMIDKIIINYINILTSLLSTMQLKVKEKESLNFDLFY